MGVLIFVAIGLFIGWLVAAILEFDEGIFAHMGLGAIGALFGAFLVVILSHHLYSMTSPSDDCMLWSAFSSLLIASIGGIIISQYRNSGI